MPNCGGHKKSVVKALVNGEVVTIDAAAKRRGMNGEPYKSLTYIGSGTYHSVDGHPSTRNNEIYHFWRKED